ncbi:MAG: ASCH domain-containing protein [Pseudomonadota bacterium]
MVAYNFQRQFWLPIRAGTKRQTVRAHRKRHAHIGEPIQLYGGMRTKQCEKLIPDPFCIGIDDIVIRLQQAAAGTHMWVEINGCPLDEAEVASFAKADGFLSAPEFGHFWLKTHGPGTFEGVVIRWGTEDQVPSS